MYQGSLKARAVKAMQKKRKSTPHTMPDAKDREGMRHRFNPNVRLDTSQIDDQRGR